MKEFVRHGTIMSQQPVRIECMNLKRMSEQQAFEEESEWAELYSKLLPSRLAHLPESAWATQVCFLESLHHEYYTRDFGAVMRRAHHFGI
jgi:hypothetical protein